MSRSFTFGILIASSAMLFASNAYADCSNPAGIQGEMFYNGDFQVIQFCNGTDWLSMGGGSSGGGAGITDGDKGDITVSGSGSSWLIDDDLINFTELSDTMTLDASTEITASGTNVLSIRNEGTGDSFVVYDGAVDTTPFVITADGSVGIGVPSPTQALDVQGKTTSNSFIAKPVTGAAAPTGGSGSSGIQVKTTTERDAISSPTTGMVIYNTTTAQLEVYNGSSWVGVGSGATTAFFAYRTTSTTANNTIVYDTETVDTSATFSTSTGAFTAPSSGVYQFSWGSIGNNSPSDVYYLGLRKNGVQLTGAFARSDATATGTTDYMAASNTAYVTLAANDTVSVYLTGGTPLYSDGSGWVWFGGHKLSGGGSGGGGGGGSSSGTAGYLQLSGGSGAFASSSTSAGQQLFWDTTNHRLGIGTITPSAKMHVQSSTDVSTELARFVNPDIATDGNNAYLVIGKSASSANSAAVGYRFDTTSGDEGAFLTNYGDAVGTGLFVKKGGNVGIGTTSPTEKLTVYGVTDSAPGVLSLESSRNDAGNVEVGRISAKNSNETSRISFLRGGGSYQGYLTFSTKSLNDASAPLERMRIDTAGNVGIGTASPSQTLSLNVASGNNLIGFENAGTAKAYIGISSTNDNPIVGMSAGDLGLRSANEDIFMSADGGSSGQLVIKSSGNVGIGTSSPGRRLTLSDAAPIMRMQDNDNTDANASVAYLEFSTSNGTRIGYIGDGSNGSPSMHLVSDAGSVVAYAGANSCTYTSGASWSCSVDRRGRRTPLAG